MQIQCKSLVQWLQTAGGLIGGPAGAAIGMAGGIASFAGGIISAEEEEARRREAERLAKLAENEKKYRRIHQ